MPTKNKKCKSCGVELKGHANPTWCTKCVANMQARPRKNHPWKNKETFRERNENKSVSGQGGY